MTVEIVDNSPNVTVVVSGSNYYELLITDASELSMSHVNSISNPHQVTKSQVGLGNVIDAEQLLASQLEDTLTPTASGSVPTSKAVADYVASASPAPTANTIVTLINASAEVIADANIATSIARDTEVSSAISQATASLVNTNDSRLSDARTPTAHTQAASTITDFDTEVSNNTNVAANTSARHTHANAAVLNAISGSGSGEIITAAERSKLAAIEAGATADLTGSEIITLINGTAGVIDDDNIASTIARDSEVTSAISTHTGNATAHHSNANDPTSGQKAALAGTSGTPADGNRYVTNADSRLADARTPVSHAHGAITNTGYLGSTANIPLITGTAGIIQAGTFGTAANTFCVGNDSRLSDARTPVSHVHGNISNSGAIGTTANLPIITTTSGVLVAGSFGTTSGTFCAGNDSRLSDARTPLQHAHAVSDVTGFDSTVSGNSAVTANTNARHTHSNSVALAAITDAGSGVVISAAERSKLAAIEAGATGDMSGSEIVSAINGSEAIIDDDNIAATIVRTGDSRMTDARTPLSHVHGNISNAGAIGSTANLPVKTTTDGVLTTGAFGTGATDFAAGNHSHSGTYEPAFSKNTAFNKNFGTTSSEVCVGNDSRLSDARAPLAHTQAASTITDFDTEVSNNTDVAANTGARHTHTNSAALASITDAGSGVIISSTERTKLSGIESGATADMTASEILTAIKTVDGASSGLDSDTIDGYEASAFPKLASTNNFTGKIAINASKYTAGGNYPFVYAQYGPSLKLYANEIHEYFGNSLWFADKYHTITTQNVTNVANCFRTGDNFATIENSADSIIELLGTLPQDTNVSMQRIYIQFHGNVTANLKVEIKRSDDSWVTLADEAINVVGREYWFSQALTNVAAYPTYWSLKGFKITISGMTQATSYLRQIGIFSYTGMNSNPNMERIGGTFYGNVNWISGTAPTVNSTAVVLTNDVRLSDARTPTAHAHGNITNTGYLGSTANIPLITGTAGVIQAGSFGTGANTFCAGNDSRLSDARTPTSHNNSAHSETYITASGVTYEALNANSDVGTGSSQVAAGDHAHSGVYEPVIASKGSAFNVNFGTTTGTACQGDDSRLSNARTPTSHGNEAHSSTFITAADVHSNANDPSASEKAALAGTSGTPGSDNKYVTNADSRMTDARAPTSHAHGNISMSGYIYSTANKPLITGTAGIITTGSFGTDANTFCQGNDARLSDARTPTSHAHGNITNGGLIGTTANLPIITGTGGILQAGAFGTGATNFCVGNDSRLSDARTPTSHNNSAHSETYITAAGVTYEQLNTNGDVGTTASTLCAGNDSRLSDARTPTSHTHGSITNDGYLGSTANIPLITGTSGVIQAGSFGTSANTFCQGNDTRLVDNAKQADRPFVFQTGHTAWATGLSNEEIGRIQLQTGETLYIKRVEIQIKGGGTSSSLSVNAYDSSNTTQIASQTAGGVNTTGGNSGSAALVLIRLTNSVGSTQNASVYISGWIRS